MKDSGIDWLGKIPAHWEVKKCRYLFSESNRRSKDGVGVHLSMSQKFGLVPQSEIESWRLQSEDQINSKMVKQGDLALNHLKAHLGVFAVARQAGLVSPDYSVFRPEKSVAPQYYERLFKHPVYVGMFNKSVRGIVEGFYRLYSQDFFSISVPVPTLEEPLEILRYCQKESDFIGEAMSKAEQEIKLIQELRTTLISDAVTGKITVI